MEYRSRKLIIFWCYGIQTHDYYNKYFPFCGISKEKGLKSQGLMGIKPKTSTPKYFSIKEIPK